MTAGTRTCRRCGAALNPSTMRGLCPACLLETSLGVADEVDTTDPVDTAWLERNQPGAMKPEPLLQVRRLGDYELLEEIGRGGMGVIYRARQVSLDRLVAVKTILTGPLASRDFTQRFQIEAHAAAVLEHPNIVPIYEVGNYQGQPFYSMRLIAGRNLAQELKATGPMPPRRAAELVVTVAWAVHYAHERGVLHRDLKPANILLDPEGNPHVTDFGLAKLLEKEEGLTLTQGALGTPNYMAPEVAGAGTHLSTIAVDVYGLGAVLYHCLTGRPPFSANSALNVLRLLLDTDLVRPRAINPDIPVDLEAICLKALSRTPESRYPTAVAVADDLARFIRREPVLARRITHRQRLWHWAQRNPLAAGLSGTVVCLALALLSGTPWALWRINAERKKAVQRADEATEQGAQAEANLRRQQVARIEMLFHTDHAVDAVALLGQISAQNPTDARLAQWIANELTHRNFALPTVGPLVHRDRVCLVRFSPDGRRLLTATRGNAAQVWDLPSGRALGPALEHQASLANATAFLGGAHPIYAEFSPDGRWVATASVDNTARIWNAETGSPHGAPLRHPDWVTFVRFSPEGKLLATACKDGVARLWDTATGEAVGNGFHHEEWVNTIVFSPDGKRVLTAADDKTARVWDTASGKPLTGPLQHGDWVRAAVFSPDGHLVGTASSDKTARIWDADTGVPRTGPLRHQGTLNVIQFSPDGRWLATGSYDRSVRIWQVAKGELQCPPLRHASTVRSLDFSPDGLRLVTASEDRTARIWAVRDGAPLTEALRHDDVVWSACFSPDGSSVATASSDRTAFVWDVRPGKAIALRMETGAKPISVHWVDNGRRLLAVGTDVFLHNAEQGNLIRHVRWNAEDRVFTAAATGDSKHVFSMTQLGNAGIWDAETGRPVSPIISHGAPVTSGALSPDEKFIATASRDGQVKVWDTFTAREICPPLPHPSPVTRVGFCPDGRLVATVCEDFRVRLWRVPEGTEASVLLAHEEWIHDLAFSPDGRFLATASQDGMARVWDIRTGRLSYPPLRHRGAVLDVDFSTDGQYLATGSRDGVACVWDAATGRPRAESINFGPPVMDAALSPDAQWLALCGEDGRIGVWDVQASQPFLTSIGHSTPVYLCQFSPDGRRLATGAGDHYARIWDLMKHSGEPPAWLPKLVEAVAGRGAESPAGGGRAAQEPAQALRSRLLSLPAGDEWSRWAHWFLADRAARNVSPRTDQSVAHLLTRRRDQGSVPDKASFDDLIEALWIRPQQGDLYAQAAIVLASPAHADDPDRQATVDWLSRRGMDLQPTMFRGLWARASYLDLAGDPAGAANMIEQAMAAGSQNAYFWLWSAALLEKVGRIERGAFALSNAIELADHWLSETERQQFRQLHADYLKRHGRNR
ncbi:MAG TPA: protein kinase [Verrucomicrobiae bacterium]